MALSREHRLRGRFVFDRIYQKGRRIHGQWMVLRTMAAKPELLKTDPRDHTPLSCRLGVVVSSKVSKRSVERNRLRRLLHGHLSRLIANQGEGIWLLISLKPGSADTEEQLLLGECSELLAKAGLRP
ncbi:MAG: ribonuclease P protein component [Cyanobacteria bacterium]|jgi:ribonuclease P protein component|uniref:ribonuclease P protein component n=1 Tax=unclassified Vulcanococcus TaxID=2766969 RepID=UPI000D794938|nr:MULTISPECIES: ribonuclease P protein component [unclassified Vulcanococcus]MDA0727909.1 ribonuclease P protein component [Cyanobacteriota bacterium]NCV91837.1 ribonuclease P protein component [Synechococcaceae bacterium WB7_3xG_012]PWL21578.1 MAG: ribonuclease P protein component [Synechococcus sp. XM-24]MDA0964068.1 ribonuclease P protein component [Cyanobacteriota bacterium]MDA1156629.1 ribonuclease P protein component [Cyanobacteriota bacterium]